MRHGKKIHRLSRPAEHRRALLNNLASALITYKQIQTTESKAKALKPYIDRLIATARKNTLHSKRLLGQKLANKAAVKELLNGVVPKLEGRESGYTRILHYGTRRGDGARLSVIQLLLEEEVTKKKKTKKKATRKTASKPKKEKKVKETEEAKIEAAETEADEAKAVEETLTEAEVEATETETPEEESKVEAEEQPEEAETSDEEDKKE